MNLIGPIICQDALLIALFLSLSSIWNTDFLKNGTSWTYLKFFLCDGRFIYLFVLHSRDGICSLSLNYQAQRRNFGNVPLSLIVDHKLNLGEGKGVSILNWLPYSELAVWLYFLWFYPWESWKLSLLQR